MAMNKKLEVGSILFTYTEADYGAQSHRYGRTKYTIRFKVLHVHNRRERTTGVYVPSTLKSTLDKLGIRHTNEYADKVCAVGCRALVYHTVHSDSPYPTTDDVKEAQEKLELRLQQQNLSNYGIDLFEIDFVESFKQKKMSNKDALFAIQKPLEDYINNEQYIN